MSGLPKAGRNTIFLPIDKIKIAKRSREDLGDIESLAESIKYKGQIQPITVDQDFNLLAGGRRLEAHKALERDTIEAIIRPVKDKVDAMEIELIENVHRKDMTWQEVSRLEKRIFDYKAKLGHWTQREQAEMLGHAQGLVSMHYQMAEALELMPELGEFDSFDEAWKELKKLEERVYVEELRRKTDPIVGRASRWAKDHYHVGDAFAGMQKCDAGIAHFAEIDPPYAVGLDKRKSRNKRKTMSEYNEVDPDEYINFYERTAKEVFRLLRDNSFAVFWFGWDWYGDVRVAIQEAGFKIPTVPTIWTKGSGGQTASPDTTFGSCHEPFWLARKGKPKLSKPGRGNVFSYDTVPSASKIHPTERPIGLMVDIIETICFPGSQILVPFLGSGATLRAAYKIGHTGFGWDLSSENKARFLEKVVEDTLDEQYQELQERVQEELEK